TLAWDKGYIFSVIAMARGIRRTGARIWRIGGLLGMGGVVPGLLCRDQLDGGYRRHSCVEDRAHRGQRRAAWQRQAIVRSRGIRPSARRGVPILASGDMTRWR